MRPGPVNAQMLIEQVRRRQDVRVREQHELAPRFPDPGVAGAAAAPVFGGKDVPEVRDVEGGDQFHSPIGGTGVAEQQLI